MVVAGTASTEEFAEKKQTLLKDVMGMTYSNEASFKEKIDRLIRMYQKGWIDEKEYHSRQVEILKAVEGMTDFILRTRLYMVARDSQLITVNEFEEKKQALINEIFAPYESMDEFQEKVGMLLKLRDGGIITDDEFNSYKNKLMNDL